MPKKFVLAVIDAMKPAMLERAIATGRAPTLERLIQEGQYTDECVAAFPSVTPVCAASIATGTGPAEHEIPAMNWWHRGEERYVEYGTSFGASRAFGIRQSLTDTIYNMNLEHLSRDVKTVFESLDDKEIRTAGTTYLMYRGRHRHEPSVSTALSRLAHTAFGLPTWGPKELFYADMFASRKTSCRSQLGLPGVRDQHSGCVSEFMVQTGPVRLPAAVAARQRHAFAQVRAVRAGRLDRRRGQADRPRDGGRRRVRRLPRGPRVHRLLRSLAVQGGGRDRPLPRLRRLRPARGPALARGRRDRRLPELPRRAGLRARPREPPQADPAHRAHDARAGRRGPRDADGRPPRRRGDRPRRALPRRQGGALRPAR